MYEHLYARRSMENPWVKKQRPYQVACTTYRCPECGWEERVDTVYEPDVNAYWLDPADCVCGHAWSDDDAE